MAKTCIRVEACNIGSSERHNLRSKELDYIRPELTHRNEQWVECSIAEVHRDITEKYKEATGQGLQKKATPIREGVIVISEETTIQQLQDLAEKLEERFGVHAFQIYTHKDEGANVWDGKEEAWKPNYHAHMIFDWTDGHTGKTVKLNRHDMAEMQTITAECLNMERGVSSDKKHLSAMQYKNKMETEKAEQLQKDIEQLNRAYTAGTEKITTVQKELSTAQKELNSMKTDIHINEAKEAAAKAGIGFFTTACSSGKAVICEIKKVFRPEFINRIDETVVFNRLDFSAAVKIAEKYYRKLAERAAASGIELVFSDEAVVASAKNGFDPEQGARPLERYISAVVEDPLSEMLLAGKVCSGERICCTVGDDGKMIFEKQAAQLQKA